MCIYLSLQRLRRGVSNRYFAGASKVAIYFLFPCAAIAADGSVRLLLNEPGFDRPQCSAKSPAGKELLGRINAARVSIDFAIYGIRNQPDVFEALVAAKKRGVRVRGIIDVDEAGKNYYDDSFKLKEAIGSVVTDDVPFEKDDYNKVTRVVIPDWELGPEFKGPKQYLGFSIDASRAIIAIHSSKDEIEEGAGIMHNKFFIFDGECVWTGSVNISDSCSGGYSANVGVLIEHAGIAAEFKDEFEQMYSGRKFHTLKSPIKHKEYEVREGLATVNFLPQDKSIDRELSERIKNAQKTIDVSVFYLTSKRLAHELISAKKRGVKVRIITDATAACNGYTKHELLRAAGIPVKVENWGGKMHAKACCIDGRRVVAGSMNWTSAGNYSNDENVIFLDSESEGKRYTDYFEKLWASIPDEWLTADPRPESKESGTSATDGVDNDFDGLVDAMDPDCQSQRPLRNENLPPFKIVEMSEKFGFTKGVTFKNGNKYFYTNDRRDYYRFKKVVLFGNPYEAKDAGYKYGPDFNKTKNWQE